MVSVSVKKGEIHRKTYITTENRIPNPIGEQL